MVSLKSFKALDELESDSASQMSAQPVTNVVQVNIQTHASENANSNNSEASPQQANASPRSGSSVSIVVVNHDAVTLTKPPQDRLPNEAYDDEEFIMEISASSSLGQRSNSIEQMQTDSEASSESDAARNAVIKMPEFASPSDLFADDTTQNMRQRKTSSALMPIQMPDEPKATRPDHFEIVWSNLSYRILPKWYKKINFIANALSYFETSHSIDTNSSAVSTASSSAGMNDNQHQMHNASVNGPQQPIHPSSCRQKSSQDPIEIFTNLNGTIRSGQMTAVLGPSGAGKTTLLNCLTGKLRNGVSGHINLIGANGKHLKMCTIPQKDHLLELLTVEENLWFASKIKNPERGFDHAKNIERVIDLLGLKRCQQAKIKKISGGQHKRVSIAQELLSNPDILVLDEPTSGLDSLTCYKTISMLRDLVELSANNEFMKPMAIIVTIHQPQPKVFNLFHHVYIMANGGKVIYEGAPTRAMDTITNVTGLRPTDLPKRALAALATAEASATGGASSDHDALIEEQMQADLMRYSVDPASFLIEIASEEYGSEPIRTLSDHQRRVFQDTYCRHMGATPNPNSSAHCPSPCVAAIGRHYQAAAAMASHYYHSTSSSSSGSAKINHGFTPDTSDDGKLARGTLLAPNSAYTKRAKEQQHHQQQQQQQQNKPVIDGVEPAHNKLSKRRKMSAYSMDSNSSGFGSCSGKAAAQCKDHSNPLVTHNKSSATGSSSSSLAADNSSSCTNHSTSGAAQHTPAVAALYMSEQLLYTREANHKGRFWSHTATLTHRTLLTIRRDPLLMTSRVVFHLMIPLLMYWVYGTATGAANACPHYESEIDITELPSLVENKRIEYMLEELHMSIENVSMFFIIMYAFAAAVLALNALSFPLNMQVLLKETRNGWYSMSSYVVAKTVADLPLELTMPSLTMLLVYSCTGQPNSYMQWRMLTICLIMTLCSLIAQTQALIIGALVMSSVQTAVFVSQASQLPWVILAGFTIRIKRLSDPLKFISLTSFYRLGCEAITLARYGFGICKCDPNAITGEPVQLKGIPDQLRTLASYWMDSLMASKQAANDTETVTTTLSPDDAPASDWTTTTTLAPVAAGANDTALVARSNIAKNDIFQNLANQLSYANSYGVDIRSCDDVTPDRIRAINLGDQWLVARIWHLIIMLIVLKVVLYYAVRISISIRL